MPERIKEAVQAIGLSYVIMMFLSVSDLIQGVFGDLWAGDYPPLSVFIVLALTMALVFIMWARSSSPFRTPIAAVMMGELVYTAAMYITNGALYSRPVYVAVALMWIAGIWIMYTGPGVRQVIKGILQPIGDDRL